MLQISKGERTLATGAGAMEVERQLDAGLERQVDGSERLF
jgi:hypothetical protein